MKKLQLLALSMLLSTPAFVTHASEQASEQAADAMAENVSSSVDSGANASSATPSSKAEESSASLPDDLAQAMSDYAVKNKIKVNDTFIGKIIANVKIPQGWKSGMAGLQSPSGFISNADIIKAVKNKSGQQDVAGVLSQSDYERALKHLKGTPAENDDSSLLKALRTGKTYKEYKDILAGGTSQSAATISKENYNTMLDLANKAQEKKKLQPRPLSMALTIADPKKTYIALGLPTTEEFKDALFPSLGRGDSYEQFLVSPEYQQYLKDNNIADASVVNPAASITAVPAKAAETAIILSNPLVDKAQYDALSQELAK